MFFAFTNEQGIARADEVVDYLRGPRLWVPRADYPDYDEWLGRVHCQLKSEEKRVMLALDRDAVVGAVVYQRHRADPRLLELKNVSVLPDARGRHVAAFLLRNVELEGARDYPGVVAATVDAKAVGIHLFGPYLLAVELASMLLLAALVAAYHLGRNDIKDATP